MPNISANYFLITYDDLIADPYKILHDIHTIFKLNYNSRFKIANPHRHQYYIEDNIKNSIDSNLKWDVENKLGFYVKN
jgi:hypothetical protein